MTQTALCWMQQLPANISERHMGRNSGLMMKQDNTHKRESGSGDYLAKFVRRYLTALYSIAQLG
jgi:hypothetical protein